jgi:hypothetical protein
LDSYVKEKHTWNETISLSLLSLSLSLKTNMSFPEKEKKTVISDIIKFAWML